MNNDDLKPFGFIPGTHNVECTRCHQTWSLMAETATHCKRCAKALLKETMDEIDATVRANQDREIMTDDLNAAGG